MEADVLVVPLREEERPGLRPLRDLDRALGGRIAAALDAGELSGRAFETALWPVDGIAAARVLFVGAGKRSELDADRVREVFGAAARQVRTKFSSAALVLRADADAEPAAEGFLLGSYEPDLYRSDRKRSKVESVALVAPGRADLRRRAETAVVLAEATNLCRTLVSEPPNELTPGKLGERARAELTPRGVKVDVLTGRRLERFGGLLGVAKGSDEPPVFITMSWDPPRARSRAVLGLVGKGITFDSGGLSLKPADAMTWMKGDMAGAAAVICAMQAIARLKVPVAVKAVVPATENMPSGRAVRVGDVLRPYSGKTIEVLNTDAEGRLVLADGLAWLAEQGVTHLVDAATLTGAVEIALGNVAFGVMGRPDQWVDRVLRCSRRAGEKAWPLPLYREYREQIRSDIADMKNVGGRPAGTITAAWFLAEHVPDEIPWAHLDIAGVAWGDSKPYRAKGATGAAVRAFVRLAQDMAERA